MKVRRFLTWCMVAVLLAGVALTAAPVAALAAPTAAPAAQADDLSGTYLSSVYPAASAPGLVMLMSLYPNKNAEVVSYYFSNPPVIEQGTWESSDDSVTVSLTANAERTYDEPSTETFTVQDGALVSRGFVFSKLDNITPAQMDAATDAAAQEAAATEEPAAPEEPSEEAAATAEPAAEAAATETPAEEPAASEEPTDEPPIAADPAPLGDYEVFATNVYPAADASGMVVLLALFPNKNMEQLSVYLGKGAVLEVGAWTEDGGVIETTLTGQLDQEYETPVTSTYTRDGEELTDGIFTFHQLQVLTPADIEALTNPTGTYVSKLYPAADAPGMLTVLSLFDNNNVEQVTIYIGRDAIMEQGTWAVGENGAVIVSITGSSGETYAAPNETTYTRNGDVLSDGVFELTRIVEVTPEEMDAAGSEESASAATEDSADTAAADSEETAGAAPVAAAPVAVFTSDTLPAADSPGRVITLSLYEEGSRAEMSTDYLNDMPPIVEIGTWESAEEGQLTVTLTGDEKGEFATPTVIGFEDVDGTLTAVEYDLSLYGSEGLTLYAEE